MVPFWVLIIIRHLIFIGYPKRDFNFDNYPYVDTPKTFKSPLAESTFPVPYPYTLRPQTPKPLNP